MTTHVPNKTSFSAMAAYGSGASGKIVLLNSGNYPSYSSYLNSTYIWNGSNGNKDWTATGTITNNIDPAGPLGPSVGANQLSARVDSIMAYDGTNVMLYSGRGSSSTGGVFQDVWLYNTVSQAWSLSNTTAPYGRYKAQAAYLAGTGVIMFGGETQGNLLNESWKWVSGSGWSQISVANGVGPGARTGHAMAGSTTQILMFGGENTNSLNAHSWLYTVAGGWAQQFPTTSPSARSGHCLSYDSNTSLWVLFGGKNQYGYLNDTWTYSSGSNVWTQISVANGTGPAGKIGASFAYDSANTLSILYGGLDGSTGIASSDTWGFNSTLNTWTKL